MLGIRFTSFQHNVEVSTVNASVAKDFISVFWNNFQVTKNPATKEQWFLKFCGPNRHDKTFANNFGV